ncbi:MAG: 2-amino-4-hydroxy-6-hydroxymethyldihydropteridine diphosphokinase [Gammaproteobacteria bacterium]
MPSVFVAAGSNVEPERNLAKAGAALAREFPDIEFSPWYRNEAVGFEGDDFINFVFGFSTELPVHDVLAKLREVEALCGREPGAPKWAPRSMDLDLLLYGDLVHDEAGLHLPRPDLLKRPFMLGPLADLAPELRHPTANATIGELWRRFDRAAHPMTRVPPSFTSPRSAHRPPRESDR